jgi:hypothetical protein
MRIPTDMIFFNSPSSAVTLSLGSVAAAEEAAAALMVVLAKVKSADA